MQAGKLRHIIFILAKERYQDDNGQAQSRYVAIHRRHAQFSPLRGRELLQAQNMESRHTHKGVMRYYANLTADMAIGFRGDVYDIGSSWDVDNRRIQTEFFATVVRGANYDAPATLAKFANGAPVQFFDGTHAQFQPGYRFANRRPVQINDGQLVHNASTQGVVLFFDGEPAQFFNGEQAQFFPRVEEHSLRFFNGEPAQFFNGEPVELFNQPGLAEFFNGEQAHFFDGEPVQFRS